MRKPENYQRGYREPAEPKMPMDYKPTGCFDDETGERIRWGEDWTGENDDSESSQQDAQDEEKADLDCIPSTASTDSPPPSSSAGSEASNSLQKTKPKEASSIKLEIGSPSACREPEVLFRDDICAGGGAS